MNLVSVVVRIQATILPFFISLRSLSQHEVKSGMACYHKIKRCMVSYYGLSKLGDYLSFTWMNHTPSNALSMVCQFSFEVLLNLTQGLSKQS